MTNIMEETMIMLELVEVDADDDLALYRDTGRVELYVEGDDDSIVIVYPEKSEHRQFLLPFDQVYGIPNNHPKIVFSLDANRMLSPEDLQEMNRKAKEKMQRARAAERAIVAFLRCGKVRTVPDLREALGRQHNGYLNDAMQRLLDAGRVVRCGRGKFRIDKDSREEMGREETA